MQNDICIIGVKLNARKVFLSQNSLVKTLAPLVNFIIDDALLETIPDIDQPLILFINIKNLIDPLLHFFHIVVVNRFEICALGWQKSGKINADVSFQKAVCSTRSVSRNIALMEDKELATDLTDDRR